MTDASLARIKDAHDLSGDLTHLASYYSDWADNYDQDVHKEGYVAPQFLVDCLTAIASRDDVSLDLAADPAVLDVGCGTGLVGAALKERGLQSVDGFDLSTEMADQARELDVYRKLWGGIALSDAAERVGAGKYDATLACGVFTLGHVPPSELSEMFRMTRPGGLAIVSTRKSYADATDFAEEVDRVQAQGAAELVDRVLDAPYIAEEGAHYWAFRVTGA